MPLELNEAPVTTTTGRSSDYLASTTVSSWAPALNKFVDKFAPKPAPKPAARLTNPAIVQALRSLKVLRERREEVTQTFRRRLAEQSQCHALYKREAATAAEYKEAKAARTVVGILTRVASQLDATVAVLAPDFIVRAVQQFRVKAPYSLENSRPLERVTFRLALSELAVELGLSASSQRLVANHAERLNLYVCPLTREILMSRAGGFSSGHHGPRQELIDAGACRGPNDEWYRTPAERAAALKLREVLLVRNGRLQVQEISESVVQKGTIRKMPDGREALLLPGARGVAEYHSGIEDTSYDDSPRHVGIEIEVNAGSHGQEERERIAAEILLATSGRMKIERDGSVTGFELITGHGKPSSVRQELAAVFRQKLLAGFRTARSTGAHVHVTAPNGENVKVVQAQGYYKGLLPFYRDLGERPNTHHCRAGMHRGRYSEINVETGRGTVEFRLFKSQLKLAKLIRNAQFAWAYMELLGQYVPDSSEEDVRARFLEGLADLPREETVELRAWMAARGHKVPHVATDLRRLYRGLGVTAAMG